MENQWEILKNGIDSPICMWYLLNWILPRWLRIDRRWNERRTLWSLVYPFSLWPHIQSKRPLKFNDFSFKRPIFNEVLDKNKQILSFETTDLERIARRTLYLASKRQFSTNFLKKSRIAQNSFQELIISILKWIFLPLSSNYYYKHFDIHKKKLELVVFCLDCLPFAMQAMSIPQRKHLVAAIFYGKIPLG